MMFNSMGQAYVAFVVSRSSTVGRIQPLSNWIAQPSSLTSLPYSTVKASAARVFPRLSLSTFKKRLARRNNASHWMDGSFGS